ncbi:MAG: septal ring lytic transglycosylase RlpA family protein [Polyangiales bacterium]
MRALLPIVALATACASTPSYTLRGGSTRATARTSSVASTAGASTTPDDAVERGVASYYGDSLAGNTTANGERYDPSARTAAHRAAVRHEGARHPRRRT